MKSSPEHFRRRLDELINRCDVFLPPSERSLIKESRKARDFSAPKSELWKFLISSIQTVKSACGVDSPHLRELERTREQFADPVNSKLDLDTCRGALEAAREDLDAGMLADLRQLVTAEAFGDLLASAVHLLEERYHIPAIAIAGAVLESSLRTLATSKGISWSGNSTISKLNTSLYSAGVYDKVVYGEIEAWGKLRNRVAHGDFETPSQIDYGAAERMIDGVQDFVLKFR